MLALGACASLSASLGEQDPYPALRNQCSAEFGYPGRLVRWLPLPEWQDVSEKTLSPAGKMLSEALEAHTAEVTRCYEEALRIDPRMRGHLIIGLVVQADGTIMTSEVRESTLCPQELGCCVANALRRIRTKPLPGGEILRAIVPYMFVGELVQLQGARAAPARQGCMPDVDR